jgi:O-antigen ligase
MRGVAAVLCLSVVAFLYWRDLSKRDRDPISWAPFVWMFIAGTRFVSSWLTLGSAPTVEAYAEGSPLDRTVFFALIVWGVVVLARRDIDWWQLVSGNKWLIAYFLYCLISMAWTDEPAILVKRWLKDLGNPIMVLVLLTERSPYEAIVTTMRRLAFFVMPVSVLFIRYYPEFGRSYGYGGGVMYSGVADNKNNLGLTCLITGICYVWTHLFKRDLRMYDIATGGMLVWLLYQSNSKTSETCLVISIAILVASTLSPIARKPTRIVTVTLVAALAYVAADSLFNIRDNVLGMLGRDATFTNRTELWAVVRGLQKNVVVGTGFMSFWTGDRMAAVWKALGAGVNQAHNGYLEQYLNLGYVGVAFIFAVALSALFMILKQLKTDFAAGVLRLCVLTAAMLYNYTEASFYGINLMWMLFLVACVDLPLAQVQATALLPAVLRIRGKPASFASTSKKPADAEVRIGRSAKRPWQMRPEESSWTNRCSESAKTYGSRGTRGARGGR